ncbi:MAG TPA: hypothetical protein VL359_05625, partial [bacterium]|nr:hypothetical protein [bacterium]
LYFGPLNSILLIPLYILGGGPISDSWLVFAAACAFAVVLALLFQTLEPLFCPAARKALRWGYAATALNVGMVACLKRPSFYEASIVTGSLCIVLAGWLAAQAFAWGNGAAGPMPAAAAGMGSGRWRLAGMGGLLLAASASRIPLGLAGVLGVGFMALVQWQRRQGLPPQERVRQLAWDALCLAVPAGAVLLALGFYNFARYGSFLETGYQYQLAGLNVHQAMQGHRLFTVDDLLYGAYAYLIKPFSFAQRAPHLRLNADYAPGSVYAQTGAEGTVGLIYVATAIPLVLAAGLALWVGGWWRGSKSKERAEAGAKGTDFPGLRQALLWFLVLGLGGLAPLLVFSGLVARYYQDFLPALMVSALCGYGLLQERCVSRGHRIASRVLRYAMMTALVWGIFASLETGWSYSLHWVLD